MKTWACFFVVAFTAAFAGSVTLTNDSQYQLTAVVQGADGNYLGQMVVKSGATNEWTNDYDFSPENEDPVRSQTPYNVVWNCMDGSSFSSLSNVNEGGMVSAMEGSGPRVCKASKNSQPTQPTPPSTTFPQPEQQGEY